MTTLKDIELFLLDMDGTVYFEDTLIEGAKDFVFKLIEQKKQYVFLTNNSSVNKNDYITKMAGLGIPCGEQNIFSSSMATGTFLSRNRNGKSVYVVGTNALRQELLSYGVIMTNQQPDIVVVGFDRELCYEKLEKACEYLDHGAEFLATNADVLYPIKNHRYIPDCASICTMITNATGKLPVFIGKPNPYMIDMLSDLHKLPKEKIAVIGDRLYTDIAAGKNANVTAVLVLSGETTNEMLEKSSIQPDFVFDSIKDITKEI